MSVAASVKSETQPKLRTTGGIATGTGDGAGERNEGFMAVIQREEERKKVAVFAGSSPDAPLRQLRLRPIGVKESYGPFGYRK